MTKYSPASDPWWKNWKTVLNNMFSTVNVEKSIGGGGSSIISFIYISFILILTFFLTQEKLWKKILLKPVFPDSNLLHKNEAMFRRCGLFCHWVVRLATKMFSPLKSFQEACWWMCQTFAGFISSATTFSHCDRNVIPAAEVVFAPLALSVWEFCHFEGNICHSFSVSSSLSKHTAPCHVTLCYIMWPVNKRLGCSFNKICLHRGRLVTPERNLLRYIWVVFRF